MKLLLTYKDVSNTLNFSESKIKRMVESGLLPKPIKIDGNVRFKTSDIELWVNGLLDGNVESKKPRGRPRLSTQPSNIAN